MKTFGEYARERIKHLSKSQKALAKELGVSPAYISQILTGKKNPPDLGKLKNRPQLKVWSDFLDAMEEDLLDVVRYQLHRLPPKPSPRYDRMRGLLLAHLSDRILGLADEIRALELHPAENLAIGAMAQIYLLVHQEFEEGPAHGVTRFRELCTRVRANRDFVEGELVRFFEERTFSWAWDAEGNDVQIFTKSREIQDAMEALDRIFRGTRRSIFGRTVPVVGHVSAGEGFEFTDGGYLAGEGFEQAEIPAGVDPSLAKLVYCVRIRGDSLREFINDGALLFIKPESWEEIKDGDLVIFKDRRDNRAFVKKVEFAGENLILKSMNPMYKNIVLVRSDLVLLERVLSIVL